MANISLVDHKMGFDMFSHGSKSNVLRAKAMKLVLKL